MSYRKFLNWIEKRNILIVYFLFSITISAFCQVDKIAGYEIVKKSPLGYLPKDSKNLPILVTTIEGQKSLATLEDSIEYMNAKPKQRNSMIAQSGKDDLLLGRGIS